LLLIDGGGEQRGGLGETVERLAQGGQGGLGGVGEQQSLRRALEERDANIVLEVLDLLRDGSRRDRKLVGGAAEIQMPGRSLEGAKSVQGWEPPARLHEFS